MKEFWNTRYAETQYAYGTQPNVYFAEKLNVLKPHSQLLFLAEGEGRNAVYAAEKGHKVTATDYSDSAKEKALQLADQKRVAINYHVNDVLIFLEENKQKFDAIVLTFAHFPAAVSKLVLSQLHQHVKPNGHVIIEAFNHNQLLKNYNSGGPKNMEMLCELNFIEECLTKFKLIEGYNTEYELNEGLYHKGMGSVVRVFAQLK